MSIVFKILIQFLFSVTIIYFQLSLISIMLEPKVRTIIKPRLESPSYLNTACVQQAYTSRAPSAWRSAAPFTIVPRLKITFHRLSGKVLFMCIGENPKIISIISQNWETRSFKLATQRLHGTTHIAAHKI
jgi:hypothetical protein